MPSAPARLGGGRKAALVQEEMFLDGPAPFRIQAEPASDPPSEVQFFDPTGTGTFVVIPAGRTTAAVYT